MLNKKMVAVFIITVGVVLSVFIIIQKQKNMALEGFSNTANKDNPSFQFESNEPSFKVAQNNDLSGPLPVLETDNLTDYLIQLYSQEFFEGGPDTLSSEGLTALLQETTIQPSALSRFSIDDISISTDDSTRNQIIYIETVGLFLYEHFKDFENENILTALKSFFEKNDPSLFEFLISAIPPYINDLLTLNVPPSWKEIHVQMLNLWEEKLITYKAIVDLQEDPLRTILAVQQLPELLERDVEIQVILLQQGIELGATTQPSK